MPLNPEDMDLEQYTTCFPSSASPKTTCRQCRLRKVRCDGRHDGCGNCLRLNFSCSLAAPSVTDLELQEDSTEELVVQLRPKRRRGSRACIGCRKMKVRCSGTLPHCTTCERRGLVCQYPVLKRQAAPGSAQAIGVVSARVPSAHVSAPASTLPLEGLGSPAPNCPVNNDSPLLSNHLPHLIDRFFVRSYPLPCFSFLHPASTREHARHGRLEKSLAFAICGIAALHSHHGLRPRREDSDIWIRMAEQLVWQHLEEAPSLQRLQALLLVINYRMETGSFQKAFMLSSLASRAAIAIGLNRESPGLGFAARETRRRTLWSLTLIDRYFSLGLAEFELFPLGNIDIQLPSHEKAFSETETALPGGARPAPEPDDLGAYSLFVRLEAVRRETMRLAGSAASLAQEPQKLATRTRELSDQLADIASHMVMPWDLTSSRLSELLEDPWLPRHIAFNLSWHQCHCDLHRLVLAGYSYAASVPSLAQLDEHHKSSAAHLCLEHAMAIIGTLSSLHQLGASVLLLEHDTALCAYHAIRLILEISGPGSQPSTIDHRDASSGSAMQHAKLGLAALKRFFPSSALAKPIIDDIERMLSSRTSSRPCPSPTTSHDSENFQDTRTKQTEGSAADVKKELENSEEQTSWAERTRQRLAIHSLLHQGDVSEDDENSDGGFYAHSAGRASAPARSSGSFSAVSPTVTRNVPPIDYAGTRRKSSYSSVASWQSAAEEDNAAGRSRKSVTVCGSNAEMRAENDAISGLEKEPSPECVLDGRSRRLQFPLFPWFRGVESDSLVAL